jgi:hypothetical protein
MTKPNYQDANLVVQLLQYFSSAGLSQASSWIWTDEFVSDYHDFIKKYPTGSENNIKVVKLCGYYETIGTLWKHRLINEELLFDWLAIDVVWNRVKGFALGFRKATGEPRMYENFEAMAKAAST